MASLKKDKQGVLSINLIQGDNKIIYLEFKEKVLEVLIPIDLTQYSSIQLDIKKTIDVDEPAFISWSVGSGLNISGLLNEILSFEFKQEFYETGIANWYYDIKFVKDSKLSHMIKGTIFVNRSTTK